MRSVPYTAEPVSAGSPLPLLVSLERFVAEFSQLIVSSRNPRCNLLVVRSLIGTGIVPADSHPLICVGISIECTRRILYTIGLLVCSRIDVRLVCIALYNIQVIQLLEVFLGHVDLTEQLVLNLRPGQFRSLTAVHVHIAHVEGDRHILSLVLHDAQLDVTVAYDVAGLVLQVNTNQRLTTYSLQSSLLVNHGLAILVN